MNVHDGTENGQLDSYVGGQIEAFQAQLLGLTLRNPLLSCPHEERGGAQLRVIDELPDRVFERLVNGDTFRVSPLPRPRDEPDDEDDDEFQARLSEFKATDPMYLAACQSEAGDHPGRMAAIERAARNVIRLRLSRGDWQPESSLSRDELAQKHDIKPGYELPVVDPEDPEARYADDVLQTKLFEEELNARLRLLRDRARSNLNDRGVSTLFAAFGFLEWYDHGHPGRPLLAPLLLVPVEIERHRRPSGAFYSVAWTGEDPRANETLAAHLRQRFDMLLPEFDDDDSPETYFAKVGVVCEGQDQWAAPTCAGCPIFSATFSTGPLPTPCSRNTRACGA